MIEVVRFDEIDSTSTHARRLIDRSERAFEAPVVFVAKTQHAGRGQMTRAWSSPAGGLWCTFVWPVAGDRVLEGLGVRIGVACARTIEKALRSRGSGLDVRIKWPNDVYVRERKILGVLTEAVSGPRSSAGAPRFLLIGVGINANFAVDQLPSEIAARATTLAQLLNEDVDLDRLLESLANELSRVLGADGLERSTLAEARFRLLGVGKPAEVRTGAGSIVSGVLVGLSEEGLPIVRTTTGDVLGMGLERW